MMLSRIFSARVADEQEAGNILPWQKAIRMGLPLVIMYTVSA